MNANRMRSNTQESEYPEYWAGRFWCDVTLPNGRAARAKRCFPIGLKSTMTEKQARAQLFSMIQPRERASRFRIVGASSQEPSVNVICRGSYAEYVAALDLMRLGFEVFRAMNHRAPCDLIAMRGKDIYRIEVKFVGSPLRRPVLTSGKFDIVAVVSSDSSVRYSDADGQKLLLGLSANGQCFTSRDVEMGIEDNEHK